ncbi:hypothetical protein KUTeg_008745 [Tegillarca granosa]|uniref:Uncharacterized protein n=1 Tax=Tegillarca granosa TaxID=220873 RepID=A0ABQ9F9Z7_TEGGR|nr:hypothetical protein KUTeg_008745 [Tegillarca granosa]
MSRCNISIIWQGKSGMRWGEVLPKINHLITFIEPPSYSILLCGVRLRINRIISKYVICNGSFYVRYQELTEKYVGLFDQDGVIFIGNDLFLYRIQQALISFTNSNDIVSSTDGESVPWLYF